MTFIELASKRFSVRKYLKQEVEQEKLDLIFRAANVAPTAANRQPVRYFILQSNEALSKIKEVTTYHFEAPLWILVAYDSELSWKNKYTQMDKGDIDSAIVITHMMLQAAELGLGTCWIGSFDANKAQTVFNLPHNIVPVAMFPLGYPDPEHKPSSSHDKREDINSHIMKL
jgi:nitroreductase